MHRNQHIESRKVKKEKTISKPKNKIKPLEKNVNKMEISDLPDRVQIMFPELRRTMDKQSENFNKEKGNIRKSQTEITVLKHMKNTIEGFKTN